MMNRKVMKRCTVLLAILAATISIPERPAAADEHAIPSQLIRYADLVFFNGQVLTVDAEFSVAQALAIRTAGCLRSAPQMKCSRLPGRTPKDSILTGVR